MERLAFEIRIYRMAGNIGVELYLAVDEKKPVLPNFNLPI